MNKNLCMFIGFLLVGILGTFHEFFLSGFDKMPGTPVDARFINYILEHIYSWVFQIPQHYELFSPPFFYPMKNTLFYSDTMLSVAPIYFVFRLFNEAFISYALTVISFFVLNYTAFYFILKHFKFKPLYSCLGALLYAFSLLNNIHIIHAQMLTQFFSLFAILCLLKVSKNNKHNTHLFVLFGLLIPCQFYSGFYLGYFTFVGFLFGLIICLFFKKSRRRIYIFFRRYYKQIITSFGLMVLLLTPLAVAYLSVEEARDFAESVQAMFLFSSFRNSNSILWGHSIDELFRYREVYVSSFGYVTLLVGFVGLFLFNKRFFILTFLIFLCLFQYNGISLVYIFMPIPGTTGIRFWYRLLFLMLPFITVGVVYAFSLLNVRSIFTYMLLALIVVEQIPIISYFAWSRSIEYWKIREYSRLLPASCKVVDIESTQGNSTFFYRFLDSMWYSHFKRIYSRAGYTGIFPESLPALENPKCELLINDVKGDPPIMYE